MIEPGQYLRFRRPTKLVPGADLGYRWASLTAKGRLSPEPLVASHRAADRKSIEVAPRRGHCHPVGSRPGDMSMTNDQAP
jgi:hypothetical protein